MHARAGPQWRSRTNAAEGAQNPNAMETQQGTTRGGEAQAVAVAREKGSRRRRRKAEATRDSQRE